MVSSCGFFLWWERQSLFPCVLFQRDLKINERLKKGTGVSEWIRRKDEIMLLERSRDILEEERTVKNLPLMERAEVQK